MAQKIQTLFIDDIDGGEAEGTVHFGLDSTEYEIDLSTAHSSDLRKTLELAHPHFVPSKSESACVIDQLDFAR